MLFRREVPHLRKALASYLGTNEESPVRRTFERATVDGRKVAQPQFAARSQVPHVSPYLSVALAIRQEVPPVRRDHASARVRKRPGGLLVLHAPHHDLVVRR